MRRYHLFLVSFLVLAAAPAASAGQLPQEFVSLYRPAVDRLRQAYAQVSVEGTLRVELPQEQKSSEQSFVFRADGNRRRLDTRTLAQRGMNLKVGASQMQMATPIGSLNTYTNPGSSFFDDARERSYADTISSIDRTSLITYPYALDSQGTILDMLQSPNVRVSSVRWIRVDGQPMVQVDYQQSAQHAGRSGLWTCSLVLSPDEGWVLRSFQRTLDGGGGKIAQRGQLQYTTGADGVAQLESINLETTRGDRVIRRESMTTSQTTFGAPNPEFFNSFTF